MRLEWTIFAFEDREAIFGYIEQESPRSAIAIDETIEAHAEQLLRHPESGRPGRIDGTRQWVVTGLPYITAYRVTDGTVHILRILHGARRWPDEMPD